MDTDDLAHRPQVQSLATRVINAAEQTDAAGRYLLGIVGPPGAGKSTLALALCESINQQLPEEACIVVPMDGFHLPNRVLEQRGLRALKGIPQTFDGEAFVRLLGQLKATPHQRVGCPNFDRSIDDPIEGAITVTPNHRLVIVEGNYLLLETPPWDGVRPLLDEVWYLSVEHDVMKQRLLQRHMQGGRNRAQAEEKILSTDLPNAELIEQTRHRADLIVGN